MKYSLIFFKLWSVNKLLFGIPYYLIEHYLLSNLLHIIYKGGKMTIIGIGSGIYYIAFPKPIEVIDNNINNTDINDDFIIIDNNDINDDFIIIDNNDINDDFIINKKIN